MSERPPRPYRDWFSALFGFAETNYATAKRWLALEEDPSKPGFHIIRSLADQKRAYKVGRFACASLGELRAQTVEKKLMEKFSGELKLGLKLGSVDAHQALPENKYATFQAASQFNCLEFPSSRCYPENGITGYVGDRTQGPACSISAGPATAYRNYFVPMTTADGKQQTGQTAELQLDNLADFNALLGNADGKHFRVTNGYTMGKDRGLEALCKVIAELTEEKREAVKAALRIGVHEDVQVTSTNWGRQAVTREHLITQVFGSACSVSYSRNPSYLWEPICRLVLTASYEATLHAALLNADRHEGKDGSLQVNLTALGGGVFGNDPQWVADAIYAACHTFRHTALEVHLIQYCPPIERQYRGLMESWEQSCQQ